MTSEPHPWQTVSEASALAPGVFLEFRLAQETADPGLMPRTGFLFMDGDRPRAYINQCPHLGIELNWMPGRFMDADKVFIQCASHGALFKPGTGECIAGPCQGDALSALEVRIVEDSLQVRLPV